MNLVVESRKLALSHRKSGYGTAPIQLRLSRNEVLSQDGLEMYHVGIIDYSQLWNCEKKIEASAKVICHCRNWSEGSAVEPADYARRFKSFLADEVFNSFDDLHDLQETFDIMN